MKSKLFGIRPAGLLCFAIQLLVCGIPDTAHAQNRFSFEQKAEQLTIRLDGSECATYYLRGQEIPRPFFAHLKTADGIQVTRNFPPIKGSDPVDHPYFHPGLWMAFGDISGEDFWRNKGTVSHQEFLEGPSATENSLSFAVSNFYLAPNGDPVCKEINRIRIEVGALGILFYWDSTFEPIGKAFYFGDQEEMGIGIRVATDLCVKTKRGGTMRDSANRSNEKEIWGNDAEWFDYAGTIDGKQVGITLFNHPDNFRKARFHCRDYGLCVANPFGQKVFEKGDASKVVVDVGQSLRLRYGVLLHSTTEQDSIDLSAAYREYTSHADQTARGTSKQQSPNVEVVK